MTDEEFAAKVTIYAHSLEMELEFVSPAVASCACIEAACNISFKASQQDKLATKFREVAGLLEATIQ